MEFLVLLAGRVPSATMIEEPAKHIGEHLEDDANGEIHEHPLRNLLEKGFLDDTPPDEAANEHRDSRRRHAAFGNIICDRCAVLVSHNNCFLWGPVGPRLSQSVMAKSDYAEGCEIRFATVP